ncbi:MAG: hypothetical protein PHW82_16205, partial [Bacteroidales bacterium]|nr:hypothetical protein [Bacteroidales bacterium]
MKEYKNELMVQYRKELTTSFHQQFAENQNNHQSAFIQFLSIILTVIIGFGIALLNFNETKALNTDYNFELFDFTLAFMIAEGILTLGFCLVVIYAYGFRRDQFVNAIIREKAKVTEDTGSIEWKIFPAAYNPAKSFKKKLKKNNRIYFLAWMPDFHSLFAVAFFVLQIILLFLFVIKCWENNPFSFEKSIDLKSVFFFIL